MFCIANGTDCSKLEVICSSSVKFVPKQHFPFGKAKAMKAEICDRTFAPISSFFCKIFLGFKKKIKMDSGQMEKANSNQGI